MRQAGILAAAGVHALAHHVDRLAEDHANAKTLARAIAGLPGIAVEPAHIETNIVYFGVAGTGRSAPALSEALEAQGIRIGAVDGETMRAVTHLDVTRADIDAAASAMSALLDTTRAR